jgi:hypothetical protein
LHPILDAAAPLQAHLTGPRPSLAEALRKSLVPSSVQELGRRGYRDVKVLPREAVEHMVAEAAARLVEDRWELAIETERARIAESVRGEAAALAEALAEARRELAAEREERQALDRWRADAVRRLSEAEERSRTAEARLSEAQAAFEAQLAAVLADPHAFARLTPDGRRRRRARALARRRVKAAVKRLAREVRELRGRAAAAPLASAAARAPAARPPDVVVERIARRSFGFGNPRAVESRVIEPPAPPLAPAAEPAAAPAAPGAAPPAPGPELGAVAARLAAIESKLDALLATRAEADEGVPSRFRDGRRAGIRPGDAQYHEKSAILRKLAEDNVKLRRTIGS